MKELHYEILDETRRALVPSFSSIKERFYLAGGTGLALQIGHRDSVDFDFFSRESFDTAALFEEIREMFAAHHLLKTQDERDTLSVMLDESVSISFFGFPYPLVADVVETAELRLASIADIGCMKLSAITSRATLKDYVDLFFILRTLPLSELLADASEKFPQLDQNLILKSLVYFDDITDTAIKYMPGYEVPREEIRDTLQRIVKEFVDRKPRSSS